MGKMTINQSVRIHNVLEQTIQLNDGLVTGGIDWAFTLLRDEVAKIQKAAEIKKKDVNEFLKEIGDNPSQVIISLTEKDLPAKTPSGLSQVLSPIMQRPELKEDYYTSLIKEDKKEDKKGKEDKEDK